MKRMIQSRIKAGLIAFALVVTQVLMPVQSAYAVQPASQPQEAAENKAAKINDKVFVCKYVKTPGQKEVASHIISVAVNKVNDYKPGDYFTDAQFNSYVIEFDNGQAEPEISECPKYVPSPPKPSTQDLCNPVTLLGYSNVSWMGYEDTTDYTWMINTNGSITATAKSGVYFKTASGNVTSVTFELPADKGIVCETPKSPVSIPAQQTVDLCNAKNVAYNVVWKDALPADTDEIVWSVNTDGTTRTATLKDDRKWTDNTNAPRVFTLPADSGLKCVKNSVAAKPGQSDPCGRGNDTFTIQETEGVDYIIGEEIVKAGVYPFKSGTSVTVGAQAQDGYKLTNYEGPWTLTFTNTKCESANVCTVSNKMYDRVWQYNGDVYPEAGAYPTGVPGSFDFQNEGLYINTPDTESYVSGLFDAGKTPIGDVDAMGYKVLRQTKSAGVPVTLPAYILSVDTNGLSVAGGQKYFFYEPYYNDNDRAAVEGVFQTWDAYAGGSAKWYMSGTGQKLESWSTFVSQFPDAIVLAHGFNQGTSNAETYTVVQDIKFDCATVTFRYFQGNGGVETPVIPVVPTTPVQPTTPVVPVSNVAAQGNGALELPAELPTTGTGSSVATWFALLAAILTYGAVLFLQPKKRAE